MLRARLANGLRFSPAARAHLHQHARGVAADDGVVHHQHRQPLHRVLRVIPAGKRHVDGVVLDADALLAHLLRRHDEGARDVPVLRQALDVLLAQRRRDLRVTPHTHANRNSRVATGVRYGHHHVDHLLQTREARVVARVTLVHHHGTLALLQHAQPVHALRQAHAHLHARLVHGDVVHHGVGPRQVHVLEDAGLQRACQRVCVGVKLHVHVQEQHLARAHVA